MLYDNEYYFVVPDSTASESDKTNEPYAIVPSFEDWPFPHGYIPSLWRPIDNNISIGGGSGGVYPRCAVSNNTWSVNKCHLIPNCKKLWFDKNGMSQYGSSCLGIDDPDNMCILRQDIHNGFDSFIFAFVPKRHGYVVHALQVYGPWPEFTAAFHDVPFRGAINVEYLFARFAYAVFTLIKTFVTNSRISRRVARHLECSDERPSINFETKIEWITGKKLNDSYARGKSRSSSPHKKAKGNSNNLQTLQQQHRHRFSCNNTLISDSQESIDEIEVLKTPIDTPSCYDIWDELSEGYGQWEDEEPRGRTRKRDSSVSDYEEDQGQQKRRAMQSVTTRS
ncbi:hypothetical protein E0Z10_g7932 [Xylaria hypoxylon]|uniref:HNH nuclease domain-containing protein n=1 Tax=Xylaria hypoxylon TaxID=37992 RepID=A0A4Z0Y9I1_9PEZI|nr:hypothetical protein E0Z10_g7932 [Xylaria hypoxylon]